MMRFARVGKSAVAALALAGMVSGAGAAERRPVAAVTIYPGDMIRADMLADADFPNAVASSSFVSNHSMIIGKVAKRTLLPGQPIPTNAVGEPRLVTIGAMVRIVYEEGGLSITTYASALQAGGAGDVISVRNRESGIVISGVIHPDGSIHIGPS